MKTSLWLAWRELINRKSSFMIGISMVSIAVALCATIELVSRAREEAIASDIDSIGPALRLIPAGLTSVDLARFELGTEYFTKPEITRIHAGLSPWLHALDARLLLNEPLEGVRASIIGIDPNEVISPFETLGELEATNVALGIALAQKLGKKAGDRIKFKGIRFRVATVLPSTGSTEDLALFLPLQRLQELSDLPAFVNEIRLFPNSDTTIENIISYLKVNHPDMTVINIHRGDTAEYVIEHRLQKNRWVVYLITAFVVAFCILVWSYLNATERQLEMATLAAIGGSNATVFAVFLMRSAVVGFLGTLLGYAIGVLIAVVQDFESAFHVVLSWELILVLIVWATGLSIAGTFPVSIFSAFREHVRELQV